MKETENNYSEKKTLCAVAKRFLILVIRKKKPSSPKMSQSNDLLVSSPDALCCSQCFLGRMLEIVIIK